MMMKRLTLSLLAVAACGLLVACSGEAPAPAAPAAAPVAEAPAPAPVAQAKAFVCPMNECQEVQEAAGKCSKCGMDLVEVDRAAITYTCEMCNVSETAAGKCPKCGMDLAMKVAKPEAAPAAAEPAPAPVPEQ